MCRIAFLRNELRRGWCVVAVLAALAAGPAEAQLKAGLKLGQTRTYAFLVGCSDYDKRELRPLQYTVKDVQEFSQVLVESGVPKENIVMMHDQQSRNLLPEGKKIREQLDLLLARVDSQSTLIVALSGHGIQFEAKGSNYFCPLDARLQERETLIPLNEVYEQLQACPAERKLLLVDACRNDPQSVLAKSRAVVQLDSVSRPQDQSVPQGIVALFSCSAGQQSYEHPELKHGVFFYQMLQGWRGAADANKDSAVTLDEVLTYTKLKTEAFAHLELGGKQIPHLKGDFSGTWILKELPPAKVEPQGPPNPAGQWLVKRTTYDGLLEIKVHPAGRVDMAWYNHDRKLAQHGVGFVEDGHLFAAWGITDDFGMSLYRIRPNGTLEGRWCTPGGNVARETVAGVPGKIEGQFAIQGTNPTDGSSYGGSISITRYDETYYVNWTSGSSTYHGIGLRQGDWLAIAWANPGTKDYGIVDYVLKNNTAQGRWTVMGSQRFNEELLQRPAR